MEIRSLCYNKARIITFILSEKNSKNSHLVDEFSDIFSLIKTCFPSNILKPVYIVTITQKIQKQQQQQQQ